MRLLNRIIYVIETVAGLALAAVALLTFTAVVLRYGFAVNLPDAFDLARYLQGITIMWGLALATWRGAHISVDVLTEACRPGLRVLIDLFANCVTAGFFCLLAWQLWLRLPGMIQAGQVTSELRVVVWPFYLAATLGIAATVLVALLLVLRSFIPQLEGHDG